MRSALLPAQSRRRWTDADWAANEARINMLNAGMPGGLRGNILPKTPWPLRPPQQALAPDRAAPLFMQSASMPAPQEQEPDRLIVRDPWATGFPLREGSSRDDVLSNLARLGAQITPQHPAYWANVMAPHLASMLRGERHPGGGCL